MENEKLIWGLGGFVIGTVFGYLFAIAVNKFRWEIRTFVILIGVLIWGFVMIARVLNPSLNIGIVFDLIMGGMIGNAVGFNFGGIWRGVTTNSEKDDKSKKK